MLPPPPRSTLFPYTTLFRSNNLREAREQVGKAENGPLLRREDVIAPEEDRKSTRLNSSHRCISYAVFCLKKKKSTKNTTVACCRCRDLWRRISSTWTLPAQT